MSTLEHTLTAVEQQPELFTPPEELAQAGFLAGYSGHALDAYRLDLPQFVAWCAEHELALFVRAAPTSSVSAATSRVSVAPEPPSLGDWARSRGPHTLRHAFITAALDAGVPLRDVQEAASHADPGTTMRYDRGRVSLDRHGTYVVSAFLAGAAR